MSRERERPEGEMGENRIGMGERRGRGWRWEGIGYCAFLVLCGIAVVVLAVRCGR